ncbi:MAG: PorP/SprF family type IX secretion system membrane protein [Bacteroidia bacterium]
MRFILVLLFFWGLSWQMANAQDVSFSQPYASPIFLNPAFAGNIDGLRLSMNHRRQWNSVPGTFNASAFSADWRETCLSSGFGLIAIRDVEGEGFLNTSKMGFVYAFGLPVSKNGFLSTGFSGSYMSKTIDWKYLEFSDQFDPVLGKVSPVSSNGIPFSQSRTFADIDAGIVYKHTGLYKGKEILSNIGFAAHHLTRPDESILGLKTRLPIKYTLHSGFMMPIKKYSTAQGTFIFPHFVFSQQAQLSEFVAGMYAFRAPFMVGLSYANAETPANIENTNALVAMIAFQQPFNKGYSYQLGYSFDLNLSGMSLSTYGSHEISLNIIFDGASLYCNAFGGGFKDKWSSKCVRGSKKGFMPQF